MSLYQLTPQELQIILALAKTWEQFLTLPNLPSDESQGFQTALHAAERIILARPGRRQLLADIDSILHRKTA